MYCFFFNDTATTEIYTLSLHDALPIYVEFLGFALNDCTVDLDHSSAKYLRVVHGTALELAVHNQFGADRKSTRLNSSHANISYAVFCLKKKRKLDTSSTSLVHI